MINFFLGVLAGLLLAILDRLFAFKLITAAERVITPKNKVQAEVIDFKSEQAEAVEDKQARGEAITLHEFYDAKRSARAERWEE